MRILVVDDDANTRVLLVGALRKWGYQAVAVADGEEAWLELERDPNPDPSPQITPNSSRKAA